MGDLQSFHENSGKNMTFLIIGKGLKTKDGWRH